MTRGPSAEGSFSNPSIWLMWEEMPRRGRESVQKLRMRMMPPPGRPRPSEASYSGFIRSLETELDRAALANPDPGRPVVRRLNRFEYQNAIRDLLALEIDSTALLPPDDADLGFDNMGGILSVSPVLLERLVSAARKISRRAVGGPTTPITETYDLPKALWQDDRMSDELPFGSRGGLAVRHFFPLDGEYTIKVRLHRQIYGYLRGLDQRQRLEVTVDGDRLTVFTLDGRNKGRRAPLGHGGSIEGDPAWEDYWLHGDDALEVRLSNESRTAGGQCLFRQQPL